MLFLKSKLSNLSTNFYLKHKKYIHAAFFTMVEFHKRESQNHFLYSCKFQKYLWRQIQDHGAKDC